MTDKIDYNALRARLAESLDLWVDDPHSESVASAIAAIPSMLEENGILRADNERLEGEAIAACQRNLEIRAEVERLTAPVTGEIGELIERLKKAELLGWIRTMDEGAAALQRLAQEVERLNVIVGNHGVTQLEKTEIMLSQAARIRELETDLKQHQELNAAEHEFLLLTTAERDAARSLNTEMREAIEGMFNTVTPHVRKAWEDKAYAILLRTRTKDQSNASQ